MPWFHRDITIKQSHVISKATNLNTSLVDKFYITIVKYKFSFFLKTVISS